MPILERIGSPRDLRGLSRDELLALCAEIREFTVEAVQRTGGHISSSLGATELTVALHRVFGSPRDKLVWDTGHQAYVHKILTGRRERFDSLRQAGGISGFLVRTESEHDAFGAGHAGTSISAAHGMAVARDLRGEDHHVVAVIGDGALTAGLAFEGLNNVGHLRTRVIVVLNDNGMSISPNVGAMSRMLDESRIELHRPQVAAVSRLTEALRTARPYRDFRRAVEAVLDHVPAGDLAEETARRLMTALKAILIPNVLFEELGFTYFGPVDGHDLFAVEHILERARDLRDGPVLVHVRTQKGHGYAPAEEDNEKWHGVSAKGTPPAAAPTYTKVFADAVREAMRQDERVVAITAAMPSGTGLAPLFDEMPGRLFDVGICEQHAVTFAAGLATQGIVPVVAIYSTFLQRGFDQIVHDVAIQGLSVVFAMDRAGIVGDDGRTHQGLFDIAYLRPLPGMVLMAPKDEAELRHMVWTAVRHAAERRGPIALRYPRGTGIGVATDDPLRELPIGVSETLREGGDVILLAYGTVVQAAEAAAELLARDGVEATVVNARFAKPLDAERILSLAARTPRIVTVEEHAAAGGFGAAVMELLAERGARADVEGVAVPDEWVDHGAQKVWRRRFGLDAEGIAAAVRRRWPQLVRAREVTETAG
ncbi:MAG: 1-deoxy-D-xylulose-5-phosphate synthase [Chloroflexota bacterium]|nr:1-deoxy-D-xylulose-5-phosphate synthase [Chloroflexota bacterium]MDE3194513.1 1-deoxy-D-xylulose-5-phosphate synthase [Chloroflexota bacterium]